MRILLLLLWLNAAIMPNVQAGGPIPDPNSGKTYTRIISLAPSVTETLFILGLGDNVVGVTRFCKFPAEALEKNNIGGYFNPNYEAIMNLKPDLVVLLNEHERERTQLDGLGIPYLMLNHRNIDGILESISRLGETCGVKPRADQLVADYRKRMAAVVQRTQHLPKPKVLVSLGRRMGSGSLKDAFLAGAGSIYHPIIEMAGGQNAAGHVDRAYPVVSAEGVMRMNPDVIIDMVSDMQEKGINEEELLDEWRVLDRVTAVRQNRLHVFGEDYVTIPGPRFILLLEQMAEVLHPNGETRTP